MQIAIGKDVVAGALQQFTQVSEHVGGWIHAQESGTLERHRLGCGVSPVKR